MFTDYKTGCLRNILLQSRGVREGEIDEKYKIIGAIHEDQHEAVLKASAIPYSKELPVKFQVPSSKVQVSGRADFVLENSIDELKSTDSKNTLRTIIKKGEVRKEHLAQIVSYMLALKFDQGRLIYGYYELNKDTQKYEKKMDRAFGILIDDAGRICIDGQPTTFTVGDHLNYLKAAAHVITSGEIWDRPYNHTSSFASPCRSCPWSSTCDALDNGEFEGADAFVARAQLTLKLGENE